MSITLSTTDLSRLHRLSSRLLSPLDAESLDGWRRDVCLELRELVGGDKVYFLCEGVGEADVLWSDGFPGPFADAYRNIYRADEGTSRALRFGYTAFNQTAVIAGDWEGYDRDPVVNELYRPFGVNDVIGLITDIDSRSTGTRRGLRFQLGAGHATYGTENFGDKGLQLLHLLAPSFQAGVGMLVATAEWRDSLAGALDALGTALWVFSGDARVTLHRNQAAAALVREDVEGALIEARVGAMAARLARAARPAKSGTVAGQADVAATVPVATASGRYAVRGSYVGPSRLAAGRTILIAVSRVSPRPVAWPALRRAYGLTAREIDVARLICDGMRTLEIARRLGISHHTVCRHTERLFDKLGVHSRGEAQRVIRES